MEEEIVLNYIKSRTLKIIFQIHGLNANIATMIPNQNDLSSLMQNFDIPEDLILSGNMDKIQEYAKKMMQDQQRQMNQAKYGNNSNEIEFVPISYNPEVSFLIYV